MRTLLRDRNAIVLALVLIVGTWAYFGLEHTTGYRGGVAHFDGYFYYVYLHSLHMDGDIDFENDYREWGNPGSYERTATGRYGNVFGIGPAIMWSPFYAATCLGLSGVRALGFPVPRDTMSRFHQGGTFFGTLVYGWLAIVLSYAACRRALGERGALLGALGAALASGLPAYCLSWSSFSHAHAAMTTSLLVYLWLRFRDAWTFRRWLIFGAASGLVFLCRPACMAFALLPVSEAVRFVWGAPSGERPWVARGKRALAPIGAALIATLVFTPQMLCWKYLYGHFLVTPQGNDFMWWSRSEWAATLFSPRSGLFPSSPLMLAAVIGLSAAAWKRPRLGLPLALVFAATAFVNGAVYDWWGWGYAARRYIEALPLFAVGLSLVVQKVQGTIVKNPLRAATWTTTAIIGAFVVFNLEWMRVYTHKNLTWSNVPGTEAQYLSVTHSLVDRVFRNVGNPLSLPSSLAFAIEQGGTPAAYDSIDGKYLLGEFSHGANPAADPLKNASLALDDPGNHDFLSTSFGWPQRKDDESYTPLREPAGHIFLPLNRPGGAQMMIMVYPLQAADRLSLRLNQCPIASRELAPKRWNQIIVDLPAQCIRRGINRLDLAHRVPTTVRGTRNLEIGRTGRTSPVSIAAISGGTNAGSFSELWVAQTMVAHSVRGLNFAIIDPDCGRLDGQRAFDAYAFPAAVREIEEYLDHFPRGRIVAVALRGGVHDDFKRAGGQHALARFGAITDLLAHDGMGYAAIGVLGASRGSAIEVLEDEDHARAYVGAPPPPWREVARYKVLKLR